MSFPRKPGNNDTDFVCNDSASVLKWAHEPYSQHKDIPTFPMGVVSGFRFFLHNNLSLSSRNFALANGGHISSRTKNELNRHNYEI
jgi:hypothetical protein